MGKLVEELFDDYMKGVLSELGYKRYLEYPDAYNREYKAYVAGYNARRNSE